MNDTHVIEVADRLLAEGKITKAERKRLVVRGGKVWDDTTFPVELLSNGDVLIHGRGAYPLKLSGYARENPKAKSGPVAAYCVVRGVPELYGLGNSIEQARTDAESQTLPGPLKFAKATHELLAQGADTQRPGVFDEAAGIWRVGRPKAKCKTGCKCAPCRTKATRKNPSMTYGKLPTEAEFKKAFKSHVPGGSYDVVLKGKHPDCIQTGVYDVGSLWYVVRKLKATGTDNALEWCSSILMSLGIEWV